MVFSSLLFLFRFLPAVLLLYYMAPRKVRNVILLLFSLFFYAWGEPKYVLLMLCSITVDFFVGKKVDWWRKTGISTGMADGVIDLQYFCIMFF